MTVNCPQCHEAVDVADIGSEGEDKALCPSCSSILATKVNPTASPPHSPTGHPQSAGRYRIIRRLGGGSFGDVYLAEDPDLKRTVAVKIPRADLFDSTRTAEMFLVEAQRTAKLKHRNLVTTYDVGRLSDGGVFVVMEYIGGATLMDTGGGPLIDYQRLAVLMASVAEAVHYAHRHGL